MSPSPEFDLVIVGAGPAGLAAVASALDVFSVSEHATSTTRPSSAPRMLVIDSAEQPGGQFWRHRSEAVTVDDGRLHHDWDEYLRLRTAFDAGIESGAVDYLPTSSVWMVERSAGTGPVSRNPENGTMASARSGFTLYTAPSHGPGTSRLPVVRARTLILATGAYDRQLPVPGWDLPGVLAAGGIQAFAKQNGMLPGKNVVIAGTGPFLLPVAANVVDLGGTVAGVLESADLTGWLPRAHRAAGVPEKAIEGAGYAWTFLKHRIPYRRRTVITEILGTDRVNAVRTARVDRLGEVIPGSERTIDGVDTVGLGWGFTPQLELPMSLGVETRVDADGSLVAVVDADMQSSVPGLFLAGELTGIGGASLAVAEGTIAGLSAAEAEPDTSTVSAQSSVTGNSASAQKTVTKHRAFAQAMHHAHPVPAGWDERVHEDTVVCRCEEVTAGEIVAAKTSMAADDARTQKGMTRAGMGWCQGRVCGFAVTCLSTRSRDAVAGVTASTSATPGAPAPTATGEDAIKASLAQTMKRPVAQPVPMSTLLDL